MSIEQRRGTIGEESFPGLIKRVTALGIASIAIATASEGCQSTDYSDQSQPLPLSTQSDQSQPNTLFDNPEIRKKVELESFNRKIAAVINYMTQSEIPEFSATASKWQKLSSEGKLFILPLQEWEEGAKIGLTSRGEDLITLVAINPAFLQIEEESLRSNAVLLRSLDIQSDMFKVILDTFKIEGESFDAAVKKMANHRSFASLNADINAQGWEKAMETYDFTQVNTDLSDTGKIARKFQNCQMSGNFNNCWADYFKKPERLTAFNIGQSYWQTRQFPNISHVAQS